MDWLDEIKSMLSPKGKSMQIITAVVKEDKESGDVHIIADKSPDWTGPAIVLPAEQGLGLLQAVRRVKREIVNNLSIRVTLPMACAGVAERYRGLLESWQVLIDTALLPLDLAMEGISIVDSVSAAHGPRATLRVDVMVQPPAPKGWVVDGTFQLNASPDQYIQHLTSIDGGKSKWGEPFYPGEVNVTDATDNLEVDRDTMRQVLELFNTLLDDESPAYTSAIGRPVLKELRRVRALLPDYDGCRRQVGSKDLRVTQILDKFREGRNALGRDAGTDDEATHYISFADFKYLMGKLGLIA